MDAAALQETMPRLRRYARALVGERAAADDLVQDTLERAWQRRAQWRPGSDLRAWLFSIMHNIRVDQIRRHGVPTQTLDDAAILPTRATQSDGLEMNDLSNALAQLPEDQRAVLLLVALEEMRYEAVASALGIPVGTVMSRLSRGRERLRQILEGRSPARLRVVR